MTAKHFDLFLGFNRAHAVVSRRFGATLGALHGLALNDLHLLQALEAAPEHRLRRGELARQLGVTPSGVTWMLRPLIKRRLVTSRPDPSDARASFAVLTEAGHRIVAEALPTARRLSAEVLNPHVRGQALGPLAELLAALAEPPDET